MSAAILTQPHAARLFLPRPAARFLGRQIDFLSKGNLFPGKKRGTSFQAEVFSWHENEFAWEDLFVAGTPGARPRLDAR